MVGPVEYNFDWDPVKARINLRKHSVRFEDAVVVFKDPRAVTLFDELHGGLEERWVTVGMAGNMCICVVHHTFRESDQGQAFIRIFSARRATKREQRQYSEG